MLYILLSGRPPFDGEDDPQIIESVKKAELSFDEPIWSQISPLAKELIKKMLTKNMNDRIYAADALRHPWFKNAKTTKVDNEIVQKTLANMMKFNATQKLQQATMTMMVMNMTTKKETS